MPRRNSIKGEMRDEVISQFMLLAEAEGDKATYHPIDPKTADYTDGWHE